ncbi:hypothetical protein [Corynebacterium sp. H113]|uniref:hypothetical protein n=1 Tax=Corynebacterium sp. H113 TaxID=3133419 RepID=UPI0030B7A1D6
MTAAVHELPDLSQLATLGKTDRIAALRRSMRKVEGRDDGSLAGSEHHSDGGGSERYIAVPAELQVLFDGGLARGAVSSIDSAGAVVVALIAEATKASLQVAVVGTAQCGMLSVVEQGGDISRVVVVEDPGEEPLEVVGLLADGADLVVVDLPQAPPPSLARPIMARLRKSGCALLFVGKGWPGASVRISSELVAVHGLGRGHGRIRGIEYHVSAEGSGRPRRQVQWVVGESGGAVGASRGAEILEFKRAQ